MSDLRGTFDQGTDGTDTGISFATWQDRQLSVLLARIEQLLRELRTANASADGRKEELSREVGRVTALLEVRDSDLARQEDALRQWQAKAAGLDRKVDEFTAMQAGLRAEEQRLKDEVARLLSVEKNY